MSMIGQKRSSSEERVRGRVHHVTISLLNGVFEEPQSHLPSHRPRFALSPERVQVSLARPLHATLNVD
eukprot:11495401-Alexandrium_andersonii.AAC.1